MAGISNGKLLDLAEQSGFELMVTADSNIRAQQRLVGRKIALVVLTTNHWDTIRADPAGIIAACGGTGEGRTWSLISPSRPGAAVGIRRPRSLDGRLVASTSTACESILRQGRRRVG